MTLAAEAVEPVAFVYDDGGRADAGFPAEPRGCAVGAIAIAAEVPYAQVHAYLGLLTARATGQPSANPDFGVPSFVVETFMAWLGWEFAQSPSVTTASDLPRDGRFVLRYRLPGDDGRPQDHLSALVDGVLRDDADTRRFPMWGWWSR